MADNNLIAEYRRDLLALLPAELADEVADGLADAHEQYMLRGLSPDQAAVAAITEFGHPVKVADAFRRACPVLMLARMLVVTGPIVGGMWAAALVTARAWNWPIPLAVRLLVGLVLTASVVLLATASLTSRYRSLRHAGIAGCLGIAVLDISMIVAAILLSPSVRWLLVAAACVSMIRLTLVARSLPRCMATHV